MTLEAILIKAGLAILKALIGSGVGYVVKKDLFSNDGTENDDFRRIMREAFVDAVKATRGDMADASQKRYEQNEFRHYHKALLQELIKLDSVERKTFIEKDLYAAFKMELLKREDALSRISMAMAEECLKQLKENDLRIDKLEEEMAAFKNDLHSLTEIVKQKVQVTGLSPAKMIEDANSVTIALPPLHSDRKELVEQIKTTLEERHIALLYAGVKEGKTVTSELLSKSFANGRTKWFDFAYTNSFNVEAILSNYSKEDKILFVFDSVKYDNEAICNNFCQAIISQVNDNWYFIITSYTRFSEIVYSDISAIAEHEVVPLTQAEVEEMVPVEKRPVYGSLIFSLFSGQPLLSNMACAFLDSHGWEVSYEEIGRLFTFPKGTPLEKKIAKTARYFVKGEEEYRLMNRLMLFDHPFTIEDCSEIAGISPAILNPKAHLDAMTGTWLKEENGRYAVSSLLRKAMSADLLPQERSDCSLLLARKIIHQPDGITPLDAARVLMLLTNTRDDIQVTSFYVNSLYKLDEAGLLEGESSFMWRMLWVNVPLPEWMSGESKVFVRMSQLALLVLKHHIGPYNIAEDLEILLRSLSDRSKMKAAGMKALVAYNLLEGQSQKALELQLLSRQYIGLPELREIDDEKVLLLTIDKVCSIDDLLKWGAQYEKMGKPEVDLLGEGIIVAISRICKDKNQTEIAEISERITVAASQNKMSHIAIVACTRWIGALQDLNKYDDAANVYGLYSYLTDIPFGRLLINYSYGLCLVQQGKKTEAEKWITDACSVEDIALSASDALNARCKLAQLLGDKGEYEGALGFILQLLNHKDFGRLYMDYEQASIHATAGYAYWMAGYQIKAVKELLMVESLLWEKHSVIDYNFKNLSIRFSILVLYLCSTLEGNKVREDFLPADYETFTKVFSWIEEEYKPLRNFTSMYPMYELSERILHDDAISLRMVEHMVAYQQTDGKDNGALLTIMMLSYPLCLRSERYDLFEYIVLKSLSSSVNAAEEKPVNYEELVLISAIQSYVMTRTCYKYKGREIDDDFIIELIRKARPYLPNHEKTDIMENLMLSDNPDFQIMKDQHCRYIAGAYHLDKINVKESIIMIYLLALSLIETNKMPSAMQLAEQFALSYALLTVRSNPKLFGATENDMAEMFGRLKNRHGKDYIKGILQGLHFKMKVEPFISEQISLWVN